LQHVTLPNTVVSIEDEAFSGTKSLSLNSLPSSLVSLGARAFSQSSENITISELPVTLETIGTQAFSGCSNVTVNRFGCDDESKLQTIGYAAFAGACKNNPNITEIVINKGVVLGTWKDINDIETYGTFRDGYPYITSLTYGFNHNYLTDAEFIEDIFGEDRSEKITTITKLE
jgi:hypothetical protein